MTLFKILNKNPQDAYAKQIKDNLLADASADASLGHRLQTEEFLDRIKEDLFPLKEERKLITEQLSKNALPNGFYIDISKKMRRQGSKEIIKYIFEKATDNAKVIAKAFDEITDFHNKLVALIIYYNLVKWRSDFDNSKVNLKDIFEKHDDAFAKNLILSLQRFFQRARTGSDISPKKEIDFQKLIDRVGHIKRLGEKNFFKKDRETQEIGVRNKIRELERKQSELQRLKGSAPPNSLKLRSLKQYLEEEINYLETVIDECGRLWPEKSQKTKLEQFEGSLNLLRDNDEQKGHDDQRSDVEGIEKERVPNAILERKQDTEMNSIVADRMQINQREIEERYSYLSEEHKNKGYTDHTVNTKSTNVDLDLIKKLLKERGDAVKYLKNIESQAPKYREYHAQEGGSTKFVALSRNVTDAWGFFEMLLKVRPNQKEKKDQIVQYFKNKENGQPAEIPQVAGFFGNRAFKTKLDHAYGKYREVNYHKLADGTQIPRMVYFRQAAEMIEGFLNANGENAQIHIQDGDKNHLNPPLIKAMVLYAEMCGYNYKNQSDIQIGKTQLQDTIQSLMQDRKFTEGLDRIMETLPGEVLDQHISSGPFRVMK